MIRLLLRRLGQGVLVVFVLETITFFLVRMLPGNPFLGERKLPEHIMQQLQSLYGLEESAWVQYWNYWKNILLHGDFGPSLIREGVPVSEMIAQAFPVSFLLGVLGMAIAMAVDKAGLGENFRVVEVKDQPTGIAAVLSSLNVSIRKAFTRSGSGRDQGEPSTAFTGM